MDIRRNRDFLKDTVRLQIDFSATAQNRGVPPPPVEKAPVPGSERVALVARAGLAPGQGVSLRQAVDRRCSRRRFTREVLSVDELSFLLWATQGVRRTVGNGLHTLRTVPSAGARHALETYVAALRVDGLAAALYHYLPVEHELERVASDPRLGERLDAACLGQGFIGQAAAVFVWTAIPQRMEWRYGLAAHRVILLDAGHVCQNLYLACEDIGAGTCAVAAYHQQALDALLRVDGEEEFAIYLAPVGKV
jgi:SagB-type dehydrogenase family enzyme